MRLLDKLIDILTKVNNKSKKKDIKISTPITKAKEKPLYKPNLNPRHTRKDELINCSYCNYEIFPEDAKKCYSCDMDICPRCTNHMMSSLDNNTFKSVCDNCSEILDSSEDMDLESLRTLNHKEKENAEE